MRIALVGGGRMGRAVRGVAEARGHEIVVELTGPDNAGGRALTAERLGGAEVVMEFTRPEAAVPNLTRLAGLGVATVTGTTGWYDRLAEVEAAVRAGGGALLYAPNFSLGARLLERAARELARALRGREDFDPLLVERHHREKRDAPSGTALALQDALRSVDPDRAWPVASERVGWVPGTHGIRFEGRLESLEVLHTVRDRAVFAEGAVLAAEWLPGRRGLFTFDDLLGGTP